MKIVRNLLICAVIVSMVVAGVFFGLANDMPVPLDLLFLSMQPQSLALWILIAFTIGGVIGMLVSSAIMLKLRASLAVSRRQLQKAQLELASLREGSSLEEAA